MTRATGIGATSVAIAWLITTWTPRQSRIEEWSIATAYVAITLLAISLSLGPLNVLRQKHNPVHSPTRRDFGIAAGIFALVHTALGLQVHLGGAIAQYFTLPSPPTSTGTAFVIANYVGLVSALVLVVLVAISNNPAIRTIGLTRWKRTQRLVYAAAPAAALHGLVYQVIEDRTWILVATLASASIAVSVLQMRAAAARRRLEG